MTFFCQQGMEVHCVAGQNSRHMSFKQVYKVR